MSTQSEKGLMSKTKKELVEIILRKDDVERQLKADKESVEKALENTYNSSVFFNNAIKYMLILCRCQENFVKK